MVLPLPPSCLRRGAPTTLDQRNDRGGRHHLRRGPSRGQPLSHRVKHPARQPRRALDSRKCAGRDSHARAGARRHAAAEGAALRRRRSLKSGSGAVLGRGNLFVVVVSAAYFYIFVCVWSGLCSIFCSTGENEAACRVVTSRRPVAWRPTLFRLGIFDTHETEGRRDSIRTFRKRKINCVLSQCFVALIDCFCRCN